MRIAIDLDDTLSKVDRLAGTSAYVEKNNLPFRLINPDAHVLQDMYDWQRSNVDEFVLGGGIKVFTEAPVRAGAREALAAWKAAGHELIILTARIDEWFGDPVNVSREWLERNKIPYDEIVANVWEKGEYCKEHKIDVLIEDNYEICKKAQDLGVKAVLFVDKHNRQYADKIRYAGSEWRHISSCVEYIVHPPRKRYE